MKNHLRALGAVFASFLFFSNFNTIVAMSSKSKKSFSSCEYSGSLDEEIDITNHQIYITNYRKNLLKEKFKYIRREDEFYELKRSVLMRIAYDRVVPKKFVEDLVSYGLAERESTVKNSILHLKENLNFAKLIISRNDNVFIYTLDVKDDASLLDVCLMVKFVPNYSFELFPGLGKVNRKKFIDTITSKQRKDLINSLQRHFDFKGIDISSDEE